MFNLIFPIVSNKIAKTTHFYRVSKPLILTYAITHRCNSRCVMCGIWKIKKHNELSLYEIENLFASKTLNQLESLDLTGGEPFLRQDIVNIAKIAEEKLNTIKELRIVSNGFLPNIVIKRVKEILKETDLKLGIKVSLDGMNKTHEKLRRVKNAFSLTTTTLRELAKLKNDRLNVYIGFTVMPENYNELIEVYKLSQNLGIDLLFKPAISANQFYNIKDKFILTAYSNKILHDIDYIRSEFKSPDKRFSEIEKSLREIIQKRFINCVKDFIKRPNQRVVNCYAALASLFINPNGDVFPCVTLNDKLGNVTEKPLDELWNSERANNIRKKINKGQCSCITTCDIIPSIVCDQTFSLVSEFIFKKI